MPENTQTFFQITAGIIAARLKDRRKQQLRQKLLFIQSLQQHQVSLNATLLCELGFGHLGQGLYTSLLLIAVHLIDLPVARHCGSKHRRKKKNPHYPPVLLSVAENQAQRVQNRRLMSTNGNNCALPVKNISTLIATNFLFAIPKSITLHLNVFIHV